MATNMINSLQFIDTHVFSLPYGYCETGASTAAKVVTVDNFSLETGAVIIVKFRYANSVASPTLNVNSTGAKPIYRYGKTLDANGNEVSGAAASTGTSTTGWRAGAVQIFVYDGTYWVRDFWENTTYSNVSLGHGYGTCSTAAATLDKAVTLSSYTLSKGGIVSVRFTNSVPASATMSINGKDKKAIYFKNAAITADVIKAGDTATFMYDGTYYRLLTIDRWQNDIDGLRSDMDSHTHNYAGSSSPGGSATSAVKLDTTTAGSATQPVYFSDGKPVAMTYTLSKSVPGNAIFTDRHVTAAANHYDPSTDSYFNLTAMPETASDRSIYYIQDVTLSKDRKGHITNLTCYSQSFSPEIELNGSLVSIVSSTPSFYAPKTLGSSSQVLIGGDMNEPMWASPTDVVPTATGTSAGITIVYPAEKCTTYTSDSGTCTPLAVQNAAKKFAITRPSSTTNKAIARYSNTTGDVQDSKIIIEDVTNTRDTSKKAQVISIPAEGGKKMVYGYCTDQVDGTSFIGGVFDQSATSYPYNQGLAIGGTSGNLLWKGNRVLDANDLTTINNALNARPTTDKYHKTGSWSGLTYTATAVGGADALAFTIPTGTTSTTVAAGNHSHSSYAPKASPALTGTPTAPTASAGTNTTQIATTAFVKTALDNRITYGTADLTEGTSTLTTGTIYLVYE